MNSQNTGTRPHATFASIAGSFKSALSRTVRIFDKTGGRDKTQSRKGQLLRERNRDLRLCACVCVRVCRRGVRPMTLSEEGVQVFTERCEVKNVLSVMFGLEAGILCAGHRAAEC